MLFLKTYFERHYLRCQFVNNGNLEETYSSGDTMYSSPLKIYTGVNNPIQIFCLNGDQKSIDVSNVSVNLSLFQAGTENELLTVEAGPIDTANGRVIGIITAPMLEPLQFGSYELAVSAVNNNDGSVWPVYMNDHFDNRVTATLCKGPTQAGADPIPVVFTQQVDTGVTSQQVDLSSRPMGSTTATLQISLVDYTGNLIGQGTMVTVPTPVDWGNVAITPFSDFTGNTFQTINGSYAFLRFILDGLPTPMGQLYNISGIEVEPLANIANVVTYSVIRI